MSDNRVSRSFLKLEHFWMGMALLIILIFPIKVSAQKELITKELSISQTYLIKLKDGSSYLGTLTAQDSSSLIMSTKSVTAIQISKDKIKSIETIDPSSIKKGKYWFPNPNSTRYIFGTSAFNLKKGEGYYQNTLLFLNSFNLGITNNISVGGGLEFLSTVASITSGKFNPIFFLTPKVGFKISDKFHAATGATVVSVPPIDSDERHYAGLLYGIGTYGNADHNLTGGLSWGSIDGEFSARPVINISGMTRISRRTALITENWLVPSDNYEAVYMYGIRFFGEKLSVDLAFLNNKDIASQLALGVPIVDFVIKF
jgi:small nuclear ribonucleoprotein (snRNP)-like protein